MSFFDLNNAEQQREFSDGPMPKDTVVTAVMNVRKGGFGPDGWLKATNDRSGGMMDIEFTVIGGQFDKRKIWQTYMVQGTSDGQKKAIDISRAAMRAMMESSLGIPPEDNSEAARNARCPAGFHDFHGRVVVLKTGIEKGEIKDRATGECYPDKTKVALVLTPGMAGYTRPERPVMAIAQSQAQTGGHSAGYGGQSYGGGNGAGGGQSMGGDFAPDWAN